MRALWTEDAGVRMHWVEAGAGTPIVLLHGLTDWHDAWVPAAERLARMGFRVLAPDLPGHGLSDRPDASYALAWHADRVAAWMRAAGAGDAHIVGHSYGGGVAQMLLLDESIHIRTLGLVAAGGLGREVSWPLRLASLTRIVERGQPLFGPVTRLSGPWTARSGRAAAELAWVNSRPGTARAFARTVHDVIGLGGQRRCFLDRIHEAPDLPPIALFWGERDPVLPFVHARRLADTLDGVRLVSFARAGHYPHREHPDVFVQALARFVADPSATRPTLRTRPLPPRASLLRRIATRIRKLFTSHLSNRAAAPRAPGSCPAADPPAMVGPC